MSIKVNLLTSILLVASLGILNDIAGGTINSGQFFILTLPNFSRKADYSDWLGKTKPAGVMLRPDHVTNRKATKKLCAFLQNEAKRLKIYPLLICIDWEGGIVSRPNESGEFHSIPSPHSLAKAGIQSSFLAGQLIGQQMKSVGINVDFTPSLDLFDAKNQVLATRCISNNPETTAEFGIAISKGLMSQNIVPVIKHYPGLMLGRADTHFNSVQIIASQKEFNFNEKPFILALQQDIPMIMVSHAQYKQFGPTPASRSAQVVTHLKRQNQNLIVITDDIAMQAYHNGQDLAIATQESIDNGFDLLIYSAKPEEQIVLISRLNELIKTKKAPDTVQALKQKLQLSTPETTVLNEKEIASELAQRALAQNINFINLDNKNIILLSVNLPKIRPAEKWFIHNRQKNNGQKPNYRSFFANLLSRSGFNINEYIFNAMQKTSITELQKYIASEEFNSADIIFVQTFFYGDGIWNANQMQWLELLKPYQDKIIVLSLGHPLEKFILKPAQIVELGSFHKPIITAAFKRITTAPILTGADRMALEPEKYLTNKNIGLLCHKCSVINNNGKIEFLPNFLHEWTKNPEHQSKLYALFAPEHGIFGSKEAFAKISSEESSRWGCPIYSLHGNTRSPTKEMLENLDLLIIDFQEVGTRCYTYLSTIALTLQAAKDNDVQVLILERPNPIKNLGSCGLNLNPKFESFLGKVYTPFIHGSTIGKIAKDLNEKIGANLTVVPCRLANKKNITQEQIDNYFLNHYIPPSPNLPTIDSVYAYPITVFIEGTNYSEGRGTAHPFEQIGAPWVNANKLAVSLNKKNLPGVYFEPVAFTPKSIPGKAENPKHKNKLCHGVFLYIQNRKKLKPFEVGQAILEELFKSYPKQSTLIKSSNRYTLDLLSGDDSLRKSITTTQSH